MEQIVESVLRSMSSIKRPQAKFIASLFSVLIGHTLLFSTDLNLNAMQIIAYYKARFQIEFLFRDGKQFTGVMDCQSCNKEAIHTHINASLTALNLLKLQDGRGKKTDANGHFRLLPYDVKNSTKI